MITVAEIESLAKQLADKRNLIEELEKPVTQANKEKAELEAKIALALTEMGKDSYKSEYGTVSKVVKWRVNLPQGEDKLKFFEFLRERGMFETMATINSNSLNSFYLEQWEIAKKDDPMAALNFSLPGIGEPKSHDSISFRKK